MISRGNRSVLAAILGLVAVLVHARRAAAETGDFLCDRDQPAGQSTADTCVIVGTQSVPDQSVLRFTKPNVRVRGKVQVGVVGHCALDPATVCASDANCTAPSLCARAGALTFEVSGLLTVENRAEISAVGQAVSGDTLGPDGGTITLTTHDLTLAGVVSVTSQGITGVPAGHAGTIVVNADGAVTLASTARLDASTLRGGCGGAITIGTPTATPLTLGGAGLILADAATGGGSIHLSARDRLTVGTTVQASNTNGDQAGRPGCPDRRGGGQIQLEAPTVTFSGSVKARGAQAAGGSVRLQGERAVTVSSTVGIAAISVSGGDADAFTSGGTIFLAASAGDVTLGRGSIEADGLSLGFGSDAGIFSITADEAMRCEQGEVPCVTQADCMPGEACVEKGGQVLVQVPLSAVGGAGAGSGCAACEIRGTRSVTVSGPVDVGGGRLRGVGGKVFMAAGGDLTVGPASLSADAADGGTILLVAGQTPDVGGALRIISGTQVRAVGFQEDGFGGDIQVEGCTLTVEPAVVANVEGGARGQGGLISLTAHETLGVASLSAFSALPDGQVTLSYRREATIAPDVAFEPPALTVMDPTLSPCPGCGNGVIEPPEECDGSGTCAPPGAVCVPPGVTGECTCTATTCGIVPGVQPGEQCDGNDLGDQTCESLGFVGGSLACRADCTFDTSGCGASVCGDGIVGVGEACDVGGIGGAPPDFAGQTCQSLGFPAGGTLACAPGCTAIIVVPHCAATVEQACTADGDCPVPESCVGGCAVCGNGFLDPGEECDTGTDNRNAPNHCRDDCRLPRCGDDTPDFSHCSGDPDMPCTADGDCPPSQTCVRGEQCDQGTAFCIGGVRDGAPCCSESDCPEGDCPGDGCSANRDDVPGCCRCDCTLPTVVCETLDCDDRNPCTTDGCDPVMGCQHVAVADGTSCADPDPCNGEETCRGGVCGAGPAPTCDDGNVCTVDTCVPLEGCRYQPIGLDSARSVVAESLHLEACAAERMPRGISRPLTRARKLIERAEAVGPSKRATRLLERATGRLRAAARRALNAPRHGVSPACAKALGDIIGAALARAECLL